jgi:hypothetical protein
MEIDLIHSIIITIQETDMLHNNSREIIILTSTNKR